MCIFKSKPEVTSESSWTSCVNWSELLEAREPSLQDTQERSRSTSADRAVLGPAAAALTKSLYDHKSTGHTAVSGPMTDCHIQSSSEYLVVSAVCYGSEAGMVAEVIMGRRGHSRVQTAHAFTDKLWKFKLM